MKEIFLSHELIPNEKSISKIFDLKLEQARNTAIGNAINLVTKNSSAVTIDLSQKGEDYMFITLHFMDK